VHAERSAPAGVRIRLACAADAPAIREIYNHYVAGSVCTFQTEPVTLAERLAWLEGHDAAHPVIVAEADPSSAGGSGPQVVGWAALSAWNPRCGYRSTVEVSVYIRHDHLRAGIGTALLGDAIARAREAGHHVVIGGACSDQTGSLRLQESFGFTPVAHFREVGFKFGRWLDVVYMQLIL
jgi:phosphinothricin acetyltransferase